MISYISYILKAYSISDWGQWFYKRMDCKTNDQQRFFEMIWHVMWENICNSPHSNFTCQLTSLTIDHNHGWWGFCVYREKQDGPTILSDYFEPKKKEKPFVCWSTHCRSQQNYERTIFWDWVGSFGAHSHDFLLLDERKEFYQNRLDFPNSTQERSFDVNTDWQHLCQERGHKWHLVFLKTSDHIGIGPTQHNNTSMNLIHANSIQRITSNSLHCNGKNFFLIRSWNFWHRSWRRIFIFITAALSEKRALIEILNERILYPITLLY